MVRDDGYVGTVTGVIPSTNEISVFWHSTSWASDASDTTVEKIETVAVGYPNCLGKYCVGKFVTSREGDYGMIIGINTFNSKIAVHLQKDYRQVHISRVEYFIPSDLALENECTDVCSVK